MRSPVARAGWAAAKTSASASKRRMGRPLSLDMDDVHKEDEREGLLDCPRIPQVIGSEGALQSKAISDTTNNSTTHSNPAASRVPASHASHAHARLALA